MDERRFQPGAADPILPSATAIQAAATSVVSFIDSFPTGPLDTAVPLHSFADFERECGGLHPTSESGYAIRQFFLNGGLQAWAVRIGAADACIRPTAENLIGDRARRTGLYALDSVEPVNLVCLPCAAYLEEMAAQRVYSEAAAWCAERRAFLLIDVPDSIGDAGEMAAWMQRNEAIRSRNAAVYFPRLLIQDPAGGNRNVGASGTIAGLYARTDAAKGVWHAPAGADADLRNASSLSVDVPAERAADLNAMGVNCLRHLPAHGIVAWGARTLAAADPEWKYVAVRRFFLFLEESIDRSTRWAVFEPNCEPLWLQVRESIADFLQSLFVKGALVGATPREACFVKCGRDTMTQADIDQGRLIIEIGVAPLKPAEFVIFRIGQWTKPCP